MRTKRRSSSSKNRNNSRGLDSSNVGAERSPRPGIKAVGMFETGTGTIGKGRVDIKGTEMIGTAELSDAVICAAVGVLLDASAEIAGVTGVEISGVLGRDWILGSGGNSTKGEASRRL